MCEVEKIISRMIAVSGAKDQTQMLDICGLSSGSPGNWRRRKKVPDGSIGIVAAHTSVSFDEIKYGKKYSPTESGHHYVKEEAPDLELLKTSVVDVINSLREKGQVNDWPASRIAEMVAIVYQGNLEDKEKKASAEAGVKIIEVEKN